MNLSLTSILTTLEAGATTADAFVPKGSGPDMALSAAATLARIALAAKRANEKITGEPLDLDKLHEITPLP